MKKIRLWSSISMILILLGYCDSPTKPGTPIPFENIEGAGRFNVPEAGTEVIKDNAAWINLWENYWNAFNGGGKTPPPSVDFERKMVIAIFYGADGAAYTGCQNFVETIEDIIEKSGKIEVRIGPLTLEDLGPCDAGLYPLQMVKIERSDLPVIFTGEIPYQWYPYNPVNKE
ncbi:MAG: hypothetical protein FVQ80_16850 [Planctomycetes bacterium]|nr:hypothetical protein [Planctomycetota bacterium]